MVLSIVIVNYNSWKYLEECVYSIQHNAKGIEYEIIVVDNKSRDGSVQLIRRMFPEVRLLANVENAGFSRACNQGIRISGGRYILLLNNDTLILPGALQRMLEIMDASPGIGLLGCRLLNTDRSIQQSFGRMIGFVNDFGRKYFTNLYEKRKVAWVGKLLDWAHSTAKDVDWVKGACMLVRRQAIYDADLMDENYFMYMEEVDLCMHIRQLGWRVHFTPEAQIIHHGGGSTSTNSYNASVEYRRSQLYFYKKHYGEQGLRRLKVYLYSKLVTGYCLLRLQKIWSDKHDRQLAEKAKFLEDVYQLVSNYR